MCRLFFIAQKGEEMELKQRKYFYRGPITMFGTVIVDHWYGVTTAVSKGRAYSNLIYRFKKEVGLRPSAKIELLREKIFTEGEMYESYGQMAFTEEELYSTSH